MARSLSQLVSKLDCSKLLVIANIVFFVSMVLWSGKIRSCIFPASDTLLNWGANLGALAVNGEYWRFVSSMFVHAGVLHLALNMYALWTFGPVVNSIYGTRSFLIIYFVSGLSGAMASIVWNPTQISAGASGALVGLAGAMLASLICGPSKEQGPARYSQPLVFFAVICASLLYGFFDPGIDNAAHIGGLAGGLLCGLVLQPGIFSESKVKKTLAFASFSSVMIVIFLLCIIMARSDKRSSSYRVAASAMAALKSSRFEEARSIFDTLLKTELNSSYFVGRAAALTGLKEYKQALTDCERALALNPKDLTAYLARARIFHEENKDAQAIKDLDTVIKLKPSHASAYNSRAWSYLALGDYSRGLKDAEEAVRLDPLLAEALDTKGMAYLCTKDMEKAANNFKLGLAINPNDAACNYHLELLYKLNRNLKTNAEGNTNTKSIDYRPEAWEQKLENKLLKEKQSIED